MTRIIFNQQPSDIVPNELLKKIHLVADKLDCYSIEVIKTDDDFKLIVMGFYGKILKEYKHTFQHNGTNYNEQLSKWLDSLLEQTPYASDLHNLGRVSGLLFDFIRLPESSLGNITKIDYELLVAYGFLYVKEYYQGEGLGGHSITALGWEVLRACANEAQTEALGRVDNLMSQFKPIQICNRRWFKISSDDFHKISTKINMETNLRTLAFSRIMLDRNGQICYLMML